jgi:hypothetical protein
LGEGLVGEMKTGMIVNAMFGTLGLGIAALGVAADAMWIAVSGGMLGGLGWAVVFEEWRWSRLFR